MTKPVDIDPGKVVRLQEGPATCDVCGREFMEHRPGDPSRCVPCHDARTLNAAETFMRAFGKAFKGGFPSSCDTGDCPSCRKRTR